MTFSIWMTPIFMIVYIVLLMLLTEYMRTHYKTSMWVWVLALLTIPVWIQHVDGWFRWAKNLSVILPLIYVGLARISRVEQRKGKFWEALQKDWVLWTLYGIVFLNIAEATMKDVFLGNHMNALAGLILCITMPFAPKFWKYDTDSHGEIIAYTTGYWNFLYTTWNACFVYAESPAYFARTCCILLAAELYPIVKRRPEMYITGRIYTLGAHLVLRSCFPALFMVTMNAEAWFNPTVMTNWGMVNGLIALPFVFWYCWQLHQGNADIHFRRGPARAEYLAKLENK